MPARFIRGGDAARLLGAPSLAEASSADEVAALVRAAVERVEAGRWIELGGFDPARLDVASADFAAALDAAAPAHPVCLWSRDFRRVRLNSVAVRFAHAASSVLEFPATDVVRRVLPRWTLEVWKDRLALLADALLVEGATQLIDLDEDAAEGWLALDDEGLLKLDGVGTTCAAKSLRRRIREGRGAPGVGGRASFAGVVFDLDRAEWSRERTIEELRLARDAGFRPFIVAASSAARRTADDALAAAGPWPEASAPIFAG